MMLEHMGEKNAADAIKAAALANIRDPNYKSMKLDELVARAVRLVQ